jgi:hypothetical protein
MRVPGVDTDIWVTSAEDQVLRKLSWFVSGGSASDRQWRDVIGLLRVSGEWLDHPYLRSTAAELGLGELLTRAITESAET